MLRPTFGLVDSADNARLNQLAPGQLVTLFGDFAEGIKVSINGIPAPLLYASAGQVNVQAPSDLTALALGQVSVANPDGTVNTRPVGVIARAPSAFLDLTIAESARHLWRRKFQPRLRGNHTQRGRIAELLRPPCAEGVGSHVLPERPRADRTGSDAGSRVWPHSGARTRPGLTIRSLAHAGAVGAQRWLWADCTDDRRGSLAIFLSGGLGRPLDVAAMPAGTGCEPSARLGT